jgi:adenine specific DNA methylase Mod
MVYLDVLDNFKITDFKSKDLRKKQFQQWKNWRFSLQTQNRIFNQKKLSTFSWRN